MIAAVHFGPELPLRAAVRPHSDPPQLLCYSVRDSRVYLGSVDTASLGGLPRPHPGTAGPPSAVPEAAAWQQEDSAWAASGQRLGTAWAEQDSRAAGTQQTRCAPSPAQPHFRSSRNGGLGDEATRGVSRGKAPGLRWATLGYASHAKRCNLALAASTLPAAGPGGALSGAVTRGPGGTEEGRRGHSR